jgi:hypothetical protein
LRWQSRVELCKIIEKKWSYSRVPKLSVEGIDESSPRAALIGGSERGKLRISTVNIRCQETAVEDTAGWVLQ